MRSYVPQGATRTIGARRLGRGWRGGDVVGGGNDSHQGQGLLQGLRRAMTSPTLTPNSALQSPPSPSSSAERRVAGSRAGSLAGEAGEAGEVGEVGGLPKSMLILSRRDVVSRGYPLRRPPGLLSPPNGSDQL